MTDAPRTGPVALPPFPPPPPAPARRRHPVARLLGAVLGWTCAGLATIGLIAHFLDTGHQALIVLASGAWALAPLSVVAFVLHLWRRGWFSVAAVVVLLVGQGVVYGPLFVAQTPPASRAATLKVMTQNLLLGKATATRLVQRVRAMDVDLFAVQEFTPESAAAFEAAGIDQLLPYSVLDPRPQSAGTGIWSRYPITDPVTLASQGLAGVVATVELPGGTTLTALSLHPNAPFPQDPGDWYRDLDHIRAVLLAIPPGPVVVSGDLNSTIDSAHFRKLLVDGYRDGAEQAGAGLVRSWPSDQGIPALVGIDHVLTRGPVVTSLHTLPTRRSDHLGLLATVVVPR